MSLPRRLSIYLWCTVALGCGGGEKNSSLGHENEGCLDGECFDGLVCESNVCVAPGTSTGEPSDGSGETPGTTSGESTGSSTDESTGDESSSSSSSSSGEVDGCESTDGGPSGIEPNGARCNGDEECQSQKCFSMGPLGGVCGECLSDADCCGGGCTAPNAISNPPMGSVCNAGELGDGCGSDEVCGDGLQCVPVLDIPTVITVSTCSACADDGDCGTQLCSPSYSVGELSGVWTCVDAGSVPSGQGCALDGSGDEACSGFCASANVMGLLELGVCGPCDPDTDAGCSEGQTCQPPEVSFDRGTLVPASCVAG